jgi:hypothetical protein
MKVKNETWTIERLQKMEPKINPETPYQRSLVWSLPAQQLLIDSILCHFDIPKIYLHERTVTGIYAYDITDGQQRMRAIWDYITDGFQLANTSYRPDAPWRECAFTTLFAVHKRQILQFKLNIAVITDATNDEVRELFSRLQKGMRLTPPELRNSISSQLGDVVRSIADNNEFFTATGCPFKDVRYHHRDLCALAFAVLLYDGQKDLKAPVLKQMFLDHAKSVPADLPEKVVGVLDRLTEIQAHSAHAIKTKWGFVDLCLCLGRRLNDDLDIPAIADRYKEFEKKRRRHTSKPERLLVTTGGANPSATATRMYDYIEAFKTSGAVARNVRRRQDALAAELHLRFVQRRKTRR